MSKSQQDHNEGQKDGAKSDGLNAWIQYNNPLTSSDYKNGFAHGRESTSKSSSSIFDTSSSDSDSDKSSDDGGCIVSTACIEAEGLNDDCMELETLRYFRDHYVINLPNGDSEISTYYKIAPSIVRTIKSLPDSKRILKDIYNSLVIPCVDLIKSYKFNAAFGLYKNQIQQIYQFTQNISVYR